MGSVDDSHSTTRLDTLPARPPTPPRDTISHDLDALPKQLTVALRSLQTPPGFSSPSSSVDSTARRKRVGFSSQAQYQEPPIYIDPPSRRQPPTPVSRSSSIARPVKGILKPSVAPNRLGPAPGQGLEDFQEGEQTNFAEMLESTLQQLAGSDREDRVDAYTILFRALKASSNLPDRIALQQKLDIFLQFIQRDLSTKSSDGSLDITLVVCAAKLLHTFLQYPGIASSIHSEFGAFLVDHCVRSLQDEQTPKEVVRHLMHAMFVQNFTPNVMSSERVGRLVNALHDLENHVTGKSIIVSRTHVYSKLVKQCPQHMAFHADWLQDVFTDLLSSTVEFRTAAIKLGMEAAYALNQDKRLVSKALDLLNVELEDKKYIDHITERLLPMVDHKEDGVVVPQVWSVIALFIPRPDTWDHLQPWSSILSACFLRSNIALRRESIQAWSCFTYRIFLDGRLGTKKMIDFIVKLLLRQVRTKNKTLHASVLGCIRNFLYYACRPGVDMETMDAVWDHGIAPLIQQLIDLADDSNTTIGEAVAILTGLIECETRRVWRRDRITDSALVRDKELPAIESKWIRANPGRLFKLADQLLAKGFAELSVPRSQFQKLWQAIVGSVAFASTKDVKLHEDTAKFVASAFTFLLSMWKRGPASANSGTPCDPQRFLDSSRDFILILVHSIGLLPNPFMDKQFFRNKDDKFIPHRPSSADRSAKYQATRRAPLHHLFLLLSSLPPGLKDDESLAQFFESTFSPFFDQKSAKAQADLARELLRLLPVDAHCTYGPWTLCAGKISASLDDSQSSAGSGSGGTLGAEYREIVKLLERGLRSSPNLPHERLLQVLQPLLSSVKNETGVAGVAIVVVEPLAAVLKDLISRDSTVVPANCIQASIVLLSASTHPRDKLAVDAARRRLWGTSNAGARQASFDPFVNLYKLLDSILGRFYSDLASHSSPDLARLFTEARAFFDRGHPQLVLRAMVNIQSSVAQWLEDKDHKVTNTDSPHVVEAMESLWQSLCRILTHASAAKLKLDSVEQLFCAAFRSTHREIARVAVQTWNQIYEHVDAIEYPETLKQVLESLGSSVDIVRPGLEIVDSESSRRLNFTESQDYGNRLPFISPARFHPVSLPPSSASRLSTPGLIRTAEPRSAGGDDSSSVKKKTKGRAPKIKLRHEDSQVQFAAIESSPAPVAQESQLLTDRQKEIRERQRETASMFPALRSSPTEKTNKAKSIAQQPIVPSESHRAATPEQDGEFDDCLTSTPTPRRGRPAPMPQQDMEMTDLPSSPPEPSRSSALAELKSRTNRPVVADEWHFSSSPMSGSPNPANQVNPVSHAMDLDDVDEQLPLDGEVDVTESDNVPEAVQQDIVSSALEVVEDTVVKDTTVFDQMDNADQRRVVDADANKHSETTPSGRWLRSSGIQITPRSDHEEFVDARSSPVPPTPSQRFATAGSHPTRLPATALNESFGVSASFENGLKNVSTAKIEIALRSSRSRSPSKQEYVAYDDILPESPEHIEARTAPQSSQPREDLDIHDTIEVAGAESKKPGRGRSKKGRITPTIRNSQRSQLPSLNTGRPQASQAPVPSTPVVELVSSQGNFDNVSPGSGRWWRKRKRSFSSSVLSSGGSKKARHGDFLAAEAIEEEIPDSQPIPEPAAVRENSFDQIPTAEDLYDAQVASLADGDESFADHTVASQELPFGADEESDGGGQAAPLLADDEEPEELCEELCEEPGEELGEDGVPEPSPQTQDEQEPEADVQAVLDFEHTDYIDEDMVDFTDDEEAVRSQLAREEEESASRPASPGRPMTESPVHESPAQHEVVTDENTHLHDQAEDAAQQLDVLAVEEAAQPEPVSKFASLMGMFRNGLGLLRGTDLTREQVYEVEDLMFEMRTELHQAERRGRA